jgi:hypothetical protein
VRLESVMGACGWDYSGVELVGAQLRSSTTASEGKPAASETGVRGSYDAELAGATGPG